MNHLERVHERQAVLWTPQMEAVVCPVACCLAHLPLGVNTDACDCCGTRVMLVNTEMPELDLPEMALLCWSCALSPDVLDSTSTAMTPAQDAALVVQRSAARLTACCGRQFGYLSRPSSPLIT